MGCFDVDERVKDMDANGVLGSLNFPSMARFCGQFFASRAGQDPDLALAVVRAYNDWHLEGWCGAHPGRFIPCTIPPVWDPQLMAAEAGPHGREGLPLRELLHEPPRPGPPVAAQRPLGPVLGGVPGHRNRRHHAYRLRHGRRRADLPGCAYERAHHLLGDQHLPDGGRPHLVSGVPEVPDAFASPWPRAASAGSPTSSSGPTTPTSTTRPGPGPTWAAACPREIFLDHVITCFIADDFGLAQSRRLERRHGVLGVRLPPLRQHLAKVPRGGARLGRRPRKTR